ncbi:MAG: hypothetical protein QOF49_857, partial [Chloroflexota bacterium]|nr:hypothetical protein [Chloroflexota bacterium]
MHSRRAEVALDAWRRAERDL